MGPVVDLMGFTVTPEGRYLASGHPGTGTDLPEPVGLIESSDRGETWEVLSRGGASDFHVLATTEEGVLRSDDDGATWDTLDTPQLMSLVAWADDRTIVGAGIDGHLLTSRDTGRTWTSSDRPIGEITALGAGTTADGETEALLVSGTSVLRTTDGGSSTEPLL